MIMIVKGMKAKGGRREGTREKPGNQLVVK